MPLRRLLGRDAVLSALVIGSVVPDFWYFLPFALKRSETHNLAGFFWFCLPVGLLLYLAWHALVRRSLVELLPAPLAGRLAGSGFAQAGLPRAPVAAVIGSLALGALSHLVWDAATHDGRFVDRVLPALDAAVFSIGAYQAYGYSLLQHASTLAGLALLGWWGWRWFRDAPLAAAPPRRFSPAAANAMLAAIAVAIAWIAASAAAVIWLQRPGLVESRELAKIAFGHAGAAALLALGAYAIAWHALGFVRGERGPGAGRCSPPRPSSSPSRRRR